MTIINLRGTSGSGKSTLVKSVIDATQSAPIYLGGRKRPYGYVTPPGRYPTPFATPGHYETPCGGCDTFKSVAEVYAFLYGYAPTHHIIFEGIMVADDVTRLVSLSRTFPTIPIAVILLTTPLEECLAAIQSRRDARNNTNPLNPANTTARAKRHARTLDRLTSARCPNISTFRLNRLEARQKIFEIFHLSS